MRKLGTTDILSVIAHAFERFQMWWTTQNSILGSECVSQIESRCGQLISHRSGTARVDVLESNCWFH